MMRIPSRLRTLASAALLGLASTGLLAGCSDSTSADSGRVSIRLTDAPGDFQKAVVTISEIYLQGQGGRTVLMDAPVTTDLLTLANTTAELVKDAVVPAGSYQELRFVITGGYIEVENESGETEIYATENYAGLPSGVVADGTLQMPSYSASGLKVKLPGDAVTIAGDSKVLLVDFDVAQSFGHEAGSANRWVMTPVLEATDFSFAAGLTVTLTKNADVTLPMLDSAAMTLGDVKAVLTNDMGAHEELAFTDADSNGTYEAGFLYVLPGTWSVDLVAPAGVTLTTTEVRPASVTVTAGQSAAQAFTVTAAAKN